MIRANKTPTAHSLKYHHSAQKASNNHQFSKRPKLKWLSYAKTTLSYSIDHEKTCPSRISLTIVLYKHDKKSLTTRRHVHPFQ